MLNVFPIHDHIIIKAINDPTLGGVLPEGLFTEDEHVGYGEVVRIGRGFVTRNGLIPLSLRIGDKVLYVKNSSDPCITVDEVRYTIISENNTTGVVNQDPHALEIPDFSGMDVDEIIDRALQELSNIPEKLNERKD